MSIEVVIKAANSVCAFCQKEKKDLKACSRCKQSYYCDTACQKSHYAAHKASCLQHSQNS